MTWALAANVANVVEAIAVVISLIFIGRQLKQQTNLTKFGNVQTLVELSSPMMLALLQDERLTEIWATGRDRYDSFTALQQQRYRHLLDWWLTYYENIFQQRRCGLLDESMYEAWTSDLTSFIRRRNLARHWHDIEHLYEARFRAHVSDLVYKTQQQQQTEREARLKA
jgi:hypothetical protein